MQQSNKISTSTEA